MNDNQVVKYQKSPIIKNLMPGLPERGKIKIGKKGETRKGRSGDYKLPQKLDYFLITTLERGSDDNFIIDKEIHKELGEKPKRIPITLLYDELTLNFQCRYSCYTGKNLQCSGDGEQGEWRNNDGTTQAVKCPCGKQDPKYDGKDKCKINGTLSVMMDVESSRVGGVWKFRTTGYNSTVGILSSLTLIKTLTGGALAGIPLNMTVMPKVATDPKGKTQTIYVVGVEFEGNVNTLKDVGMKIALTDATYRQRLIGVENEAKRLLSIDNNLIDESGDIVEEFYPDNAAPEMKPPDTAQNIEAELVNAIAPETVETIEVEPETIETVEVESETVETVKDVETGEPEKEISKPSQQVESFAKAIKSEPKTPKVDEDVF